MEKIKEISWKPSESRILLSIVLNKDHLSDLFISLDFWVLSGNTVYGIGHSDYRLNEL